MIRCFGKLVVIVLIALALFGCRFASPSVPRLEVGPVQENEETVPAGDLEAADVEIIFGGGSLDVTAGEEDDLLSGQFRYNVAQWAPEVDLNGEDLTIIQGEVSGENNWGMPDNHEEIVNEWTLAFSPQVPLAIDLKIGAANGQLDLGDLLLTQLSLDVGASNLEVHFDAPNQADMRRFTLNTGASSLEVSGLGNASPERVTVRGGVGDLTLSFDGAWARSCDADITAGLGSVTLRLPDSVGVKVNVRGSLSNVEAEDFERSGDTYTNAAFDDAEVQLVIDVEIGMGNLVIEEVHGE